MATNSLSWSELIKVVYRPADTIEGHIVCNMLRAQGVDAILLGEYQQGGVGELMPADFACIEVPEEQLAAAELIMHEYQKNSSAAIETEVARGGYIVTLLILLMLFVSISLFFKVIFNG